MVQPESRADRKARTRRAILDAALRLGIESGLASVSLRQVAAEVGIVPTAFYRHFDSLDDVGLALVDESFQSLRAMVRDVRRGQPAPAEIIARTIEVIASHTLANRDHFAFIARERSGGTPPVRAAVRHELELFERELAADLSLLVPPRWDAEDLHMLANLMIGPMITYVEDLLLAADHPEQLAQVTARAERQLRMIVIGVRGWRSDWVDQ